jgi:hypothetical protein
LWERNEESCEHHSRIVGVPVVIEPVVVHDPLAIVPVEVTDIEVAVRFTVLYKTPSIPPPLE